MLKLNVHISDGSTGFLCCLGILMELNHFVIARIIGELSKGNVTISTAIIADVTSTKKRGKGMVTKNFHIKTNITLEDMAIHQRLNCHTFVFVYIQEPSYIIFYSKHVQIMKSQSVKLLINRYFQEHNL